MKEYCTDRLEEKERLQLRWNIKRPPNVITGYNLHFVKNNNHGTSQKLKPSRKPPKKQTKTKKKHVTVAPRYILQVSLGTTTACCQSSRRVSITSTCSQKSTLSTLGLLWGHLTPWRLSLVAAASSVVVYWEGQRGDHEAHKRHLDRFKSAAAAAHRDVAVRLDLVNPEAVFHHATGLLQELFELAHGERSHLWADKICI